MASRSQTQDDYVGVSPMQNDNPLELFPFDYNGTDFPVQFPFSRPQISPSLVENAYGFQNNFTTGAFRDLDLVTNIGEHNRCPLNNRVDQDVVMGNNIPMLDNQGFSFCNVGAGTISSGLQTSNNMMSAYQGVNRVPYLQNSHDSNISNFVGANSSGPVNFHASVVDTEAQNRAAISRNFYNFSSEPKCEQTILPRVCNDQVRVHSAQPTSGGRLDGRFLSLGYQGEVASYMNSHGGEASHHVGNFSFSSQRQISDNSYNNSRGGSAVFENNVVIPLGNQTLCDDYYGMQAMTSGFDTSTIANIVEGQVKTHRHIPTPKTMSSESGIKSNSIVDLTDPFECSGAKLSNVSRYDDRSSQSKQGSVQRASFNPSVLRSNHQIAAEPQQNSHFSTDLLLPPLGTNIEESDSQDKSGLACGFVNASSGAQTAEGDLLRRFKQHFFGEEIYPPFPVLGQASADQGVGTTVNNELHCESSTINNKSLKRIINLPPRAAAQNQRRKVMPQTSRHQFSPDLLQNALGQIAIGHSEPVNTSSVNAFNIPNPLKDSAASEWARNTPSWPPAEGSTGTSNTVSPQHPIASTPAFPPPLHITPTDSSAIPIVSVDSPPVSLPVITPPIASARTKASRCGSSSSSIPATSKKRVRAANIPIAAYKLPSASDPRRSNLLHGTSTMNPPVRADWKKSLSTMAALAKMDPAFRASQILGSMSHIKWQGLDTAPTVGFKCMICKRDLSFTPDGPVIQPPIPPAVAVLPCGHTFHDHCLLRITPEDQLKDPPCIPCAVEN